jgi:hypothetical protein
MVTVLAASTGEVVLAIVVATALGLLWLLSLVLLVFDSISVWAKILWFLVLTVLAPIAIPVYLIWRWRRRRPREQAATVASLDESESG